MSNLKTFTIAVVFAIAGSYLTTTESGSDSVPAAGQPPVAVANDAEIALVMGLQTPATPLEKGKCCTVGDRCTPESDPDVDDAVPCNTTGDDCEDTEDGEPCWRWSGAALNNGKCVDATGPGAENSQCAMDPRSFRCRKFRTGTCEEEFWGTDCDCEVDSAEIWVKGKRRCAQGSTVCLNQAVGGSQQAGN